MTGAYPFALFDFSASGVIAHWAKDDNHIMIQIQPVPFTGQGVEISMFSASP